MISAIFKAPFVCAISNPPHIGFSAIICCSILPRQSFKSGYALFISALAFLIAADKLVTVTVQSTGNGMAGISMLTV
jgi:hypothetical protein